MYKENLALNNLQWLICHKTQPNPTHMHMVFTVPQVSLGLSLVSQLHSLSDKYPWKE